MPLMYDHCVGVVACVTVVVGVVVTDEAMPPPPPLPTSPPMAVRDDSFDEGLIQLTPALQ